MIHYQSKHNGLLRIVLQQQPVQLKFYSIHLSKLHRVKSIFQQKNSLLEFMNSNSLLQ